MNLDDTALFRNLDTTNFAAHIARLPDDLEAAWAHGQSLDLPDVGRRLARIVIAGAGDSALAGEMLAALVADSLNVPISVVRGYELPAFAEGQSTLIILLDHQGDHEETLSLLELADARGVKILGITSGGLLATRMASAGGMLWQYPGQGRLALSRQLGLLLALMSRMGLVRSAETDIAEAARCMRQEMPTLASESPAVKNSSKRLAGQMIGRIPLIYGGGIMAPVARWWKLQLNLNAKATAFCDELPELNHGALSGLAMLPETIKLATVCLVAPGFDHPRIALHQQITRQVLMMEGLVPDNHVARGESKLAQVMTTVQFGAYTSYYLAMAHSIDPTPTPALEEVREKLATAR